MQSSSTQQTKIKANEANCPYCDSVALADFVKGEQKGPFTCTNTECGAIEIGMLDEDRDMSDQEIETGWWEPQREPPELREHGTNSFLDQGSVFSKITNSLIKELPNYSEGLPPPFLDDKRMEVSVASMYRDQYVNRMQQISHTAADITKHAQQTRQVCKSRQDSASSRRMQIHIERIVEQCEPRAAILLETLLNSVATDIDTFAQHSRRVADDHHLISIIQNRIQHIQSQQYMPASVHADENKPRKIDFK